MHDVMQAGHAVGLGSAARRLPRVEAQVMVIATGGDEEDVPRGAPAGHVAGFGDDVEAQEVDIEATHAVDVGRAQMDVADGDARIDRAWAAGDRGNVALRTLR